MEFELANYVATLDAKHSTERDLLDRYAWLLGREGLQVRALVVVGNPRKTILEKARECDPAAIVIGMHRRGALHDLLKGSIRRSLLGEGKWPLVMVSAGGETAASVAAPRGLHGDFLQAHRTRLELRNFRHGIQRRDRQGVRRMFLEMKRHENRPWDHPLG
jgi:hypothetical protein